MIQAARGAPCAGLRSRAVTAYIPGRGKRDGEAELSGSGGKGLDEILAPVLTRVAMRRVMQADEIAGLAVYLAAPESSGMTGQSLVVDGGMLYV